MSNSGKSGTFIGFLGKDDRFENTGKKKKGERKVSKIQISKHQSFYSISNSINTSEIILKNRPAKLTDKLKNN